MGEKNDAGKKFLQRRASCSLFPLVSDERGKTVTAAAAEAILSSGCGQSPSFRSRKSGSQPDF